MKEKETITMTKKEVRRLGTINDLIENKINGTVASSYLNLSTRQVRRMKSMVLLLGPKGIVHKSRGRPGNRKMNSKKEDAIRCLIHNQYSHFGPTLASEYLLEYNKIVINKETLIEANKYLEEKFIPEFNKRFAVAPKNKENRHSILNSNTDLRDVFSIRKQRVVCNDYTIRFENKYFQLEQIQPTTVFKRDKVIA